MSVWEKERWKVFNQVQHPYKHVLSEFFYHNERLPESVGSDPESALNYLISVMYPNYIGSYATPGDLPGTSTANDYAVVRDDGDGKSAGYVYVSIDSSTGWVKRYDVDWSTEGLLAETIDRTSYMYVHKYGFDDNDGAGIYVGQTMYGGRSTNTNLTLNANSTDGTGYVQTDNILRPTGDNSIDLGESSYQWKTGFFGTSLITDTLTIATGSITDTTGAISFGDEDLTTTGSISADTATITTSATVGGFTIEDIAGPDGQISHSSGTIGFADENLETTGTVSASSGIFGTATVTGGSITDTTGAISFGDEDLSTTGTLGAGATTVTQLNADNLRLDGNTLSSTDTDGNIIVAADGSGVVDINSPMETLGQTVIGDVDITGDTDITGSLDVDNINFNINTISTTSGDLVLDPTGTAKVDSSFLPNVDSSYSLGLTTNKWDDIWFVGDLNNGTQTITNATLFSLYDINNGVSAGMTIFWDGSKWAASLPDTEVDHGSISGLDGDDHSQYMLLAGRSGGQSLIGGSDSGDDLTLESTSDATKGDIFTKDDLCPFTNASYSAGWSGTDLGDASHYYRDIYTKGEARGLRLENFTAATEPSSSSQNVGRLIFITDDKKVKVDDGSSFITAGVSKYVGDTVWNGSDTLKNVDVSANITDARNAVWALHDNSDDYERIYCDIKATSASNVRITVSPALPAGSYRLIGLE
jgi:hypothetical protein